ncbi:MAG: PAS domain S-box protein [Anaerolineae bacterium]|nr:PAS domain S-box protein [Anaerolineae bacterium]
MNFDPTHVETLRAVCRDQATLDHVMTVLESARSPRPSDNSDTDPIIDLLAEQIATAENLKLLRDLRQKQYAQPDDQLHAYLAAGCDVLGLEIGDISHVDPAQDLYDIKAIYPADRALAPGAPYALESACCQPALGAAQTVTYTSTDSAQANRRHPAYADALPGCWISTPIRIGDTVYGVLTFSSAQPKEHPFKRHDIEFVELMASDIAQTLRAAHDLDEQHDLLSLFVKHTPAAVAVLDTDMRYLLASDRWLKDYRLEDRDIIGKSHYDVFPGSADQWKAIHLSALDGAVFRDDETIYQRPDGSVEWVRWEVRPWWRRDKTVGGLIIFAELITKMKQNEEALERSQALYQALVQHLQNTAVIMFDRDMRYTLAEGAILQEAGYAREAIVGKTIFDVLPFESQQALLPMYERLLRGETFQMERTSHGLHYMSSFVPIYGADGIVNLGLILVQDTTESQQAEQRFRSLLESAPDAMVIVDQAGEIVLINGQAEKIFGYSREELVGKPVETLIPDPFRGRHPDHRAGYGADPHVRTMGVGLELYALRKDGSQFPVEISLSPIETQEGLLVSSAIRDITDRKQVEEGMARMAAIFRASDDAIIGTNAESLIVSWNPSAERLYGYSADEIMGKPIYLLVPPDHYDEARSIIVNARGGEHNAPYETVRLHKSGRLLDISLMISPIHGPDGKVIGFASTSHDISERKRAEYALKAKVEEEHSFQNYLKALHRITIELTNIDDLDEFYRRAIELGLERLGFERLGLFLYDRDVSIAQGTYGTDDEGNIIDERHARFSPSSMTGLMMRALERAERFAINHNVTLYSQLRPVGKGWNAVAVLWNGTENLGWLAADNGVRHAPVTNTNLEILSLYALTLGTLLARKQTQAALKESEMRFRRAITGAPFPIMIHAEDGEVLHLSNTWTELTGYSHDDIPTVSKWAERAYGERKDQIKRQVDTLYAREKPFKSGEFKVQTKSGDVLTWDFIAAPLGQLPDGRRMVSSMAVDITERKQTEEALERNSELLRTVLDNLPVGVWITDERGKIIQANPAGLHIWAGVRFVGPEAYSEYKGWWTATGEPIQTDEWATSRAIATGEAVLNDEIEIECFDGTHKFIMNSAVPIRDSHQELMGVVIVNQDVTEIKRAEIALKTSNDYLQQANEEVQRFAYIVSHDLRSPLINLKGFSAILKTALGQLVDMSDAIPAGLDETEQKTWQVVTEEKIPTALRFINTAVDRMDGFTTAILKLSRVGRQQLNYETVSVTSVVDHIIQSLAAQIQEQGIQVIIDELPEIEADPIVMDQILGNIITNAIKYLDPERPGRVSVFAERKDQQIVFHVQDNGRGIAEVDNDKIFAPFRRAGQLTVEGEGMGLAYVQALVKRHGGRIWFTSTPGVGSTFSFMIPNIREFRNDAIRPDAPPVDRG